LFCFVFFLITEKTEALAWHILESAANNKNNEVVSVLFAVKSNTVNQFEIPTDVLRTPRFHEYLTGLTVQTIPAQHQARYFNILMKLIKHEDDDVRVLALLRIVDWQYVC